MPEFQDWRGISFQVKNRIICKYTNPGTETEERDKSNVTKFFKDLEGWVNNVVVAGGFTDYAQFLSRLKSYTTEREGWGRHFRVTQLPPHIPGIPYGRAVLLACLDDFFQQRIGITFKVDKVEQLKEGPKRRNLKSLRFEGVTLSSLVYPQVGSFLFKEMQDAVSFNTGYVEELSDPDPSPWLGEEALNVLDYCSSGPPYRLEGQRAKRYKVLRYSTDVLKKLNVPSTFVANKGTSEEVPNKNAPFFGIELEVQLHNINRTNAVAKVYEAIGEDYMILKEDGSIGGNGQGFEIVTVPGTLQFHREKLEKFFETSRDYLRSWNTESCGIHVHLSKSSLTPSQQDLFVHFFDKMENISFVQTVAGRRIAKWAKVDPSKPISKRNTQKYRACNIGKAHTLEVRIFRGSCHPRGFFKALEFVASLQEFIASLPPLRSEEKRTEAVLFSNYLRWLKTRKKKYPVLFKWLVFRKYLTKSKGLVSKRKEREVLSVISLATGPRNPKEILEAQEKLNKIREVTNYMLDSRFKDYTECLIKFNNLDVDCPDSVLSKYLVGDLCGQFLSKRNLRNYIGGLNRGESTRTLVWDTDLEKCILYVYDARNPWKASYQEPKRLVQDQASRLRVFVDQKIKPLYHLIDPKTEQDFWEGFWEGDDTPSTDVEEPEEEEEDRLESEQRTSRSLWFDSSSAT